MIGVIVRLSRFARDQRGVSAVEFAMLAPLMVTLYLGSVALSGGISVDRKVTLTSHTLADLVGQSSSVDTNVLKNIADAAGAIMWPYPADKTKMTVSSVKIDAAKKPTVEWYYTRNGGTAPSAGEIGNIPPALLVENTWLIWSTVKYDYTPVVGAA